jgi:beta-galactosidase GanA
VGLNTIFSYVYWNLLEPSPGEWKNGRDGKEKREHVNGISNDIAAFFRIAQEEGLNVILRPGPYICGEREWGGFPAVSKSRSRFHLAPATFRV